MAGAGRKSSLSDSNLVALCRWARKCTSATALRQSEGGAAGVVGAAAIGVGGGVGGRMKRRGGVPGGAGYRCSGGGGRASGRAHAGRSKSVGHPLSTGHSAQAYPLPAAPVHPCISPPLMRPGEIGRGAFHKRNTSDAVIRHQKPGIHVPKVAFRIRPCATIRDKNDGSVGPVSCQLLQNLDHRSTMLAQLTTKVKPNYRGSLQCNAWCYVERGFREANGDMS